MRALTSPGETLLVEAPTYRGAIVSCSARQSGPGTPPCCAPRSPSAETPSSMRSAAGPLHVPDGGFGLWLALPRGTDEWKLAERARRHGVLVAPGRRYYVAEPPGPHLRLTYCASAPAQLAELI
jgi:DNA-binding transcriptional MocR family regulator